MRSTFRLCIVLAIAATGCNSRPKEQKIVPQPPPPPSYPKKQAMLLDPALHEAATREVYGALRSPDPIQRANAIEAVQDGLGAAGAQQIMAALDDPQPVVRFSAAMACGKLRLADAQPKLLQMVEDPDANVRVSVRFALHRLGNSYYSHELETLASNPDPRVRCNAALALGLLGDPSALNVLNGMTKDRSPLVKFQVAEARWRLHDLDGAKDLVAGTVSGYPDDQMFCIIALAEPRDVRVMQHVKGKLTSDYPEISLVAARAVGMLGSDAGYGVAIIGAKSSDPRQRAQAAIAFGDIGRTDAQPILSKLLQDNDPTVRLSAAKAVLELKPA